MPARWLVSTAGGTSPRWSPTGRELFYFDGASMMRVPVTLTPSFVSGRSAPLFAVTPFGGRPGPGYAVASMGRDPYAGLVRFTHACTAAAYVGTSSTASSSAPNSSR
jgi:hypothetical protein